MNKFSTVDKLLLVLWVLGGLFNLVFVPLFGGFEAFDLVNMAVGIAMLAYAAVLARRWERSTWPVDRG